MLREDGTQLSVQEGGVLQVEALFHRVMGPKVSLCQRTFALTRSAEAVCVLRTFHFIVRAVGSPCWIWEVDLKIDVQLQVSV